MRSITIKRITIDNPLYQAERELRNKILLRPIGIPDYGWEMYDRQSWHFVALNRDRLIGCVVLVPLDEKKWLENLHPKQTIRVLLQTDNILLQRLPWHLWDLLERYPQAEIALASLVYDPIPSIPRKGKVRILAILGHSQDIDIDRDRLLLSHLPDTEVCFLVEPALQDVSDRLWSEHWDILFFAGHSKLHY